MRIYWPDVPVIPLLPIELNLYIYQFFKPWTIILKDYWVELTQGDRCIIKLTSHAGMVACATISHNARYIATGSFDKTVHIWDVATKRQIVKLQHDHAVLWLELNETGQVCVSATDHGHVYVHYGHDNHDKYENHDEHNNHENHGAHDNNQANAVRTWRVEGLADISLSRTGSLCATAHRHDNTICLWSTDAGVCLHVFDWYQVNPSKVCISYDAQYLASGNNVGDVCVWNIASKQLLACVSTTYKHFLPNIAMGASTQICTLQFNEQNTRLLSGSLNGRGCIWDLDLNCVNELPNYGTVTAAAFSKDDALVSVGNTCGIFYTTFYTQKFR